MPSAPFSTASVSPDGWQVIWTQAGSFGLLPIGAVAPGGGGIGKKRVISGSVAILASQDEPSLDVSSLAGQPLLVTHEAGILTITYEDLQWDGLLGWLRPQRHSADVTVTATFAPSVTLTINFAGAGSGTMSGSGINCPGTCSVLLAQGSTVTIAATPNAGSVFPPVNANLAPLLDPNQPATYDAYTAAVFHNYVTLCQVQLPTTEGVYQYVIQVRTSAGAGHNRYALRAGVESSPNNLK